MIVNATNHIESSSFLSQTVLINNYQPVSTSTNSPLETSVNCRLSITIDHEPYEPTTSGQRIEATPRSRSAAAAAPGAASPSPQQRSPALLRRAGIPRAARWGCTWELSLDGRSILKTQKKWTTGRCFSAPLKNMKVSWDYSSQYMEQ